jgi:primosomal protein N' (replication factor Y)
LELAKLYNAKLILGTATPSVEAYAQTKNESSVLHLLTQRAVAGASMPQIEIVDLKKNKAEKSFASPLGIDSTFEKPSSPETFFLSENLESALQKTLSKKQQAILFLNKRGLGSHMFCKLCGWSLECPSCLVKLTPHENKLLCHYCNYSIAQSNNCPECGGINSFAKVGIGTAAVEKLLELHFPHVKTLRLDRDKVTKVGELEKIIEKFSKQEASVLIGTQMVAKGHDFPNVTLVGVLLADLGLSMPDFRANERTLQLLLQVSGRAGRAEEKGHVYVQTFQPDHLVLKLLSSSKAPQKNYEDFLKSELQQREFLSYPPCGKMVLLKLDSLKEKKLIEVSAQLHTALFQAAKDRFQVLGPTPAPLYKLRNRYRMQILLKSKNSDLLDKALHWILGQWHEKKLEKKHQTRLLVDVDPVQMM